jgi:hypothetical protein
MPLPAVRRPKRLRSPAEIAIPMAKQLQAIAASLKSTRLGAEGALDLTALELAVNCMRQAQELRDQLIPYLHANGVRAVDLARVTGLSRARVHQLIAAVRPATR